MKFTPKTAQEIEAEQAKFLPLESGIYDFEIISGEDTVSKKGNDMIMIVVGVFDREGNRRKITDYLLESIAYKLRHACEAVGLLKEYESGNIEGWMFEGRAGRCKVRKVAASGDYPAKNEISDYIVTPGKPANIAPEQRPAPARAPEPALADIDDDIPF